MVLLVGALVGCSDDDDGPGAPSGCPRGQLLLSDSCEGVDLTGADTEDVSFLGNGGLVLEGDITIPRASNTTKFPGVLLIHDRGAQSRSATETGQHEVSFGKQIQVFDDLRDALVEQGFVVLRYDNRLCFSENGCDNDYPPPFNGITYDQVVADAEAAAEFLVAHENVDASDVVVVGHGDGAHIAAVLKQPFTDLVMFGASYEPVDVNLAAQLETTRTVLEAEGQTPSQIDTITQEQQQLLTDLEDIRKGTFAGGAIGGLSADYWSQFISVGEAAIERIPEANYGVLQMHGTYDWDVLDAAAGAFAEQMTSHPDTTYKLFPQLTHPMVRVVNADLANVAPADVASRVDRLALDQMISWLFRRSGGVGPAE